MYKLFQLPFSKTCAWFVYFIIVTMSASVAFAVENKTHSPMPTANMEVQFENKLKQYVGIPYRKGGTSTNGLDCSGFVRLVYDQIFGIDLPHNSLAQFSFSDLKKIDNANMQPGDLIFFGNSGKKRINHVGVYLSDNKFIHASSSDGIKVSDLDERYWKKRFVGTKRHEDLGLGLGTDKIRFESSFQIPVNDKGFITSYRRDDFSKSSLKIQKDLDTKENPAFQSYGLNNSRLHSHEIGYSHSLMDGFNVNLSAIHENFDVFTAWPELNADTRRVSFLSDDSTVGTADRFGFKLASAFQPSNWLSITPSVTHFDYSKGNEDILNAPEWMFGLNTVLLPINKQWSLSMLLQYSGKDDFKDAASPYSRFSSLDLSIKLGINITDNLQFSIMGEHDKRSASYGTTNDSILLDSTTSNVFMSFDFTY